MADATQTMTDEQRKSVALEYLKAFDNGGITSTGASILELFATDAQVYFPKWGIANGREEIGEMFGAVGGGQVLFDKAGGGGSAGTIECPKGAEFKRD